MNDELKAATERWKKGDYRGKRTTYTLDPQLMADMALLADHAAASLADAPLTPMTHRALRTYDEFKPHRKPVEVAADCVRKGDKLAVEAGNCIARLEKRIDATDREIAELRKLLACCLDEWYYEIHRPTDEAIQTAEAVKKALGKGAERE